MTTDALAARIAELGRLIDPDMRESTVGVAEFAEAIPPLSDATLADFRAVMEQWARPVAEHVSFQRHIIAGVDGQDIAVYVVNGRPGTQRPAIVHMHGGGFVSGAARFELTNQYELATALDCVSVLVDYRLAPETNWKGSLEDNYAALAWLYHHAEELGADRNRIAVMGESAGGTHAALLAIEARNRAEIPLVLQLLVYPALDDRTGSSRNGPKHAGTMFWPAASNVYGWHSFLGVAPGGQDVPSAAVPARTANVAGLAPAFIGVGALDLFAAEGIEYAQRLIAAGVPTELHVLPGAVHGFDEISPGTAPVKQFHVLKREALRRAFGISNT